MAAEALDIYLASQSFWKDAGPKTLFLRAFHHSLLDHFSSITCYQTLKVLADPLTENGHPVTTQLHGTWDMCLLAANKYRDENLFHAGWSARHLKAGGLFMCTCSNELGAGSLEKQILALFGNIRTFSKRKSRVFWSVKEGDVDTALQDQWLAMGELQRIGDSSFLGRPGMFSWQKLDPGSELLREYLPENLSGRVADLGAGYGFLSHGLLEKKHKISELHLFEVERLALEAARRNLAEVCGPDVSVSYHWHDVTQGLCCPKLDWIIMNPPFHAGKAADLGLGLRFIKVASDSLVKGGRLLMVANRHLPYENALAALFAKVTTLVQKNGFKVIEARKG